MELPALTLPEHETHNHCLYGMDCLQFEALLAACDQSCQSCGIASGSAGCRKLVIDHNHQVGDWAVRGMLCSRCNTGIRYDQTTPEWALPYLDDPWWPRLLADLGVAVEMAEPGEERVTDFFGRLWFRRSNGWSTGLCRRGSDGAVQWAQLLRKFGPHNLTPVPAASRMPRVSVPRRMREGVIRDARHPLKHPRIGDPVWR